MRHAAVLLHRWVGLFLAVFLIIEGLTGAVLSWDHDIDEWLNSDLYTVSGRGPLKPPVTLAALIEARYPHAQVVYIPLHLEEGHAAAFLVQPRIDRATGKPFELGFTHVLVDPVSGAIAGTRNANEVSLSRRNLMPFLRNLHESLNMPAMWGSNRWGYRFLGAIALIWLADSFVAMTLTFPLRRRRGREPGAPHGDLVPKPGRASWLRRWMPAWRLRPAAGAHKLIFDLHRAGGLWVWGVIIVIAFTSFSINLNREVFYPALSLISKTTPGPFETRPVAPLDQPVTPRLGFGDILHRARERATREHWTRPAGGIFYARSMGFYSVAFFQPGGDDDNGGMAIANMYFDGQDGRYLGDYLPWRGTAADIVAQLQFPLHSGRIFGLAGRILMSIMGLAVAMLSFTGIVIWARKRRARSRAERHGRPALRKSARRSVPR
jgi:uncharacterized iron-regulated membrane protein